MSTEMSPVSGSQSTPYERLSAFFATGKTQSVDFRLEQLRQLRDAIHAREDQILEALATDLGKPGFEAYAGEVGNVYEELNFILKRLRRWTKPKRVPTPWPLLPARSQIQKEPLGVVLVIAPWNYPFQLVISPLMGAIAAGNCVVVKPSELAPATASIVTEIISSAFDENYVCSIEGDAAVTGELLKSPFDHFFFTGGEHVGQIVMQAATNHLSRVTLELGGKSPCIWDGTTSIERTAKRIAWGKFFNAGQTCVAPDYLLVPPGKKDAMVIALKQAVLDLFGANPEQSPDFGRIINERHFERLGKLLGSHTLGFGGEKNSSTRYFAPTVVTDTGWESPVMQEEIFGPLLPILEYESLDDVHTKILSRPKPLALYLFSSSDIAKKKFLERTSFGGGCLNDTLVHLGNPHLPFGGVGKSGFGNYHGQFSFDAFSHTKSVMDRPLAVDIPIRYPPYKKKLEWLKRIVKP